MMIADHQFSTSVSGQVGSGCRRIDNPKALQKITRKSSDEKALPNLEREAREASNFSRETSRLRLSRLQGGLSWCAVQKGGGGREGKRCTGREAQFWELSHNPKYDLLVLTGLSLLMFGWWRLAATVADRPLSFSKSYEVLGLSILGIDRAAFWRDSRLQASKF